MLLLLWLSSIAIGQTSPPVTPSWFVEDRYAFVIDSSGFELPTAVAFLNHPLDGDNSPLYLVSELRGQIKLVTRDRKVHPLATAPDIFDPRDELPHVEAEIGQIGLCLNRNDTKLFTTMVGKVGRSRKANQILRWQPNADWTQIKVDAKLGEPGEALYNDHPNTAHQIGNCIVDANNYLWVGVGDGKTSEMSHKRTSTLGKILRMHASDFSGIQDNPFYTQANANREESLIYASGFRNPHAMAFGPQEKLFVADNGNSVDRLLAVEKGVDYPWDNTDVSFTYNNLVVWARALGPSSMLFIGKDQLFPELQNHFLVSASFYGELYAVPMTEDGKVAGNPRLLVKPLKSETKDQIIMGLARGPDGIYVAMMRTTKLSNSAANTIAETQKPVLSESAIMKLIPSAQASAALKSGEQLVEDANCRGCHILDGWGSNVAPKLDNIVSVLTERLEDEEYVKRIATQLSENADLAARFSAPLESIAKRQGPLAARMKNWINVKIAMPQFDNPEATMPFLSLAPEIRESIASEVLRVAGRGMKETKITFWDRLNILSKKYYLEFRSQGFALGVLLTLCSFFLLRIWRKRRS